MAVATNPLTYNAYVTQIGVMAVVNTTTVAGVTQGDSDPNFDVILPQMLNYAELRIQRDLDLWPANTSNAYTFVTGSNVLTIPVGDFVSVTTIGATVDGATVPLTPVSREFLQNVYGVGSTTGPPAFFAPYGGDLATAGNTSNLFIVGPWPDDTYPAQVTGLIRMPSLYQNASDPLASTATTFISAWLPDLLIMASLEYVSSYQRNFGKISDDPAMAMTYEAQYQALLKGAMVEEARKKFSASAWTAYAPTPIATPGR